MLVRPVPHNPPMQRTEPAGKLVVIRELARRRLGADRPHVMQRKRTPKPSLDGMQLEVLRLMRDATAAGVISWEVSESDNNWYYTHGGPIDSYIHFKWP